MKGTYLKIGQPSPVLLWTGLIFFLMALLYSLSGIAMAYWLSAVPGNTEERIRYNLIFWATCTVVCISINFFLIYLLRKGKKA
jgi:ABC-type transport system involved in multi-copper enzyme maturation permease subunit